MVKLGTFFHIFFIQTPVKCRMIKIWMLILWPIYWKAITINIHVLTKLMDLFKLFCDFLEVELHIIIDHNLLCWC
jgi:hypothetical protein